jgi:5-methyltetrahydropteroyltriglutamate--homocysteine methyltransferase
MPLPTEPIGSVPRPADLLAAMNAYAGGKISREQLRATEEGALRDTIALFELTGSPIITDGEQTKPSFATYPLSGLGTLPRTA